ncbi:MAG: DUF979 domain-containing protein [Oscillospiraceae bacterium]|nr:DUF979 domain-containing protein [Oscillospiraceae bacterium]
MNFDWNWVINWEWVSPFAWFGNPDINLGLKLLEIVFIIMGLICIYAAVKNAKDKENAASIGTAVFWGALGIVLATGRYLPPLINGLLIFTMAVPAVFRKVKIGKTNAPSSEQTKKQSDKIGMKIFLPAFSMGIFAILFALLFSNESALPTLSQAALVGVSVGVIVAIVMLIVYDRKNTPDIFMKDSERFLSMIGPLCMLPMLLASLGAIFTAAGVGDVIATMVGGIIPYGNVPVGIIVYALGMVIFTMIMGNAFAAITVMTVGIGFPFVLAHGANPVVIGMLALTSGYCGTLMTPMAANFNIVPVAMLDMKSNYGVIKQQIYIALPVLLFQIVFMILFYNAGWFGHA